MNVRRARRQINNPILAVLDESEKDSVTSNGSREDFREKMGNLLLSMLCGHIGGVLGRGNEVQEYSLLVLELNPVLSASNLAIYLLQSTFIQRATKWFHF